MALLQLIVNALIAGSIYALVASGFSLIYTTNKFMHFAHGITVAFAGYMLLFFYSMLGLSFALASGAAILTTAILGLVMYRFLFLPLQQKKASNVILLIASLGILIFFQNLLQLLFGADTKVINYFEDMESIMIGDAIITPMQLSILGVAILLFFVLYGIMKYTKLGRNMRAVADNKELASIIGINEKKVADYSFIFGSALAGIAGILIALEHNLYPYMGTNLIVKGFTGAVIGGIDSIPGAILGSFVLGFAENFGIWYLPSGYKDAIAFILLFIFLLWRPQGILGIKKGVKHV